MLQVMQRLFWVAALAAVLFIVACESIDDTDTGTDIVPAEDEIELEAECVSDMDCAIAGCSAQLCVTAQEAPEILTTCEYREEYGCFEFTTCGCNEGKCGWASTNEYEACLADIRNNYIRVPFPNQ